MKVQYTYKKITTEPLIIEIEGDDLQDCHTKANLDRQHASKTYSDGEKKVGYKLQSWRAV